MAELKPLPLALPLQQKQTTTICLDRYLLAKEGQKL
jgi:hypothetical protein